MSSYRIRVFLNQQLKMYCYGNFLCAFTGLLCMFFGMLPLVLYRCVVQIRFIDLTRELMRSYR